MIIWAHSRLKLASLHPGPGCLQRRLRALCPAPPSPAPRHVPATLHPAVPGASSARSARKPGLRWISCAISARKPSPRP